jgi:hypothetical protein
MYIDLNLKITTMKTLNIYMTFAAIALIILSACTDPEETMSWKPGKGLHIVGPAELATDEEAEYYVDGFTVNEDYTWTLDGNPITPIRDGLMVTLDFNDAATHTLKVSNGKLEGSLEIVVE